MTRPLPSTVPRWLQALGPVAVLGAIFALLATVSPFGALTAAEATTLEILWVVTIIGTVAGVVPVLIGMCWFPIIRELDPRYLHGFMTLAAGVLAFISLEMLEGIVGYGAAADRTVLAAALAIVGIGGTFLAMSAAGEWRQRELASRENRGLRIAYLVALALGLHSLGEGLGIGVAFVQGNSTQVMLLVLAFVIHNVTEGPTIVVAVARDRAAPPRRHFALMGVLAGGPVVLGGWLGSFASSPLLAVLCYAVAVGAIVQVLLEVADLIRFDAEAVFTRTNTASFAVGFALMFLLEGVFVDLLEAWLVAG